MLMPTKMAQDEALMDEVRAEYERQLDARFAADPDLSVRFPESPCARGDSARELITFVEDRAGHDWRYAIDARKIGGELGYAPQETFETGLARTLDWYLGHEDWWRPLLGRAG